MFPRSARRCGRAFCPRLLCPRLLCPQLNDAGPPANFLIYFLLTPANVGFTIRGWRLAAAPAFPMPGGSRSGLARAAVRSAPSHLEGAPHTQLNHSPSRTPSPRKGVFRPRTPRLPVSQSGPHSNRVCGSHPSMERELSNKITARSAHTTFFKMLKKKCV